MRTLALFVLLLPLAAQAQNRADSERFQQLPHNQTQPQQWPQDQARTPLFCDQYARAAAGQGGRTQGSDAGTTFGKQTGYIATRDRKQAEALGMVGGALGSAAGAERDTQLYDFHYGECLNGARLIPTRP
jgi:hypothetical protein